MTETISQIEFMAKFGSHADCLKYIGNLRWWNGVVCPHCGSTKSYLIAPNCNRQFPHFKCANLQCTKKFTQTAGTIFQGTKIPLPVWFFVIYCLAINKKNISSRQWARNLNVTQKTAWGLMHKIRNRFTQDPNLKLCGIVEADEVFVSKGNKWTRWGGISTRKAPILGLCQRGGSVIIKCIEDRTRATIMNEIRAHVLKGSTIYTDGHPSYRDLVSEGYYHDFVEHSTHEYVRDDIHVNNIENIWSMLKKSVRNAHHSISEKHTQIYCNEAAWRYNNRHLTGHEKFNKILELCLTEFVA